MLSRAPLEFFLPAFSNHLPLVPQDIPVLLKTFPPYVVHAQGLDLDTTGLMIADAIVMDRAAVDHVMDSERTYLRPMARTIRQLQGSGRLRVVDYGEAARSFSANLAAWVDLQLDHPPHWLPEVREHVAADISSAIEQITAIGPMADLKRETLPFGILCYLAKTSDRLNTHDVAGVRRLVLSHRGRYSAADLDVLREVMRPYVTQTAFDQMLGQKLQMPFLPWESDQPFHRKVAVPEVPAAVGRHITKAQLEETRRLFATVIPQLRLHTVDELLEFLSHRGAVRALRLAVQRSVRDDFKLTASNIEALKDELILAIADGSRREKVFKICFALLGLTAGHVTDLGKAAMEGVHFILDLLDFTVDERIERNAHRKISWYMELQKMARERQRKEARLK